MLKTKEQKQIFAGCIVLIIILGLVSFWSHPAVVYKDTTDYTQLQKQSAQKQQAYKQLLASVQSTPESQAELYSEILPPGEVQKAVDLALNTTQAIVFPAQPQTKMRLSSSAGKSAVANYLNATAPVAQNIQKITDASKDDLFSATGSTGQVDSLISDISIALKQYSALSVPKEASNLASQELIALETYLDLAKASKAYMANPAVSQWPLMYKDVEIITQAAGHGEQAFNALNQKYNLLGEADPGKTDAVGNWLVPAAHAQISGSIVSIIGNPWQELKDGLRVAAATAVAQFTLSFLNQLATKIQQAYRITNFLYYTDALVAGQYVDDYLNKYVNDPLDKVMIKNFIPAVSCGQPQNTAAIFQSKAGQYLGFDPASISPDDPNYYQKLARVGDFLSSPTGWEVTYKDAALTANSAAQAAANNELNSQGNKSSRDPSGGILTTAQTSVSAMRATLQNMLASGFSGYSGDPWTAKIVSQITQNFLNQFIFQGTVLKEQKACIPVPVVNLVSPLTLAAPN